MKVLSVYVLLFALAAPAFVAARDPSRFTVELKQGKNTMTASDPFYVYRPIGKRDPFKAYGRGTGPKPPPRYCGVLCGYDLSQLKLVAVVYSISAPRALIETPDGKGYIVRTGTLVGRNGGRITSIDKNGIVVSEAYRDGSGRKVVSRTPLRLWTAKPETSQRRR